MGKLGNRTVTMVHRYSGGVIGAPTAAEPVDEELRQICLEAPAKARACMDELKVADAMDQVFAIFRRANKYIDETMPWVLGKDESKKERLDTVLYNLLESIRFGAVLLESFLPETAQKIYAQLNTSQTSMESLEQFGALPVSYTHLDVYKRQPTGLPSISVATLHRLLEFVTSTSSASINSARVKGSSFTGMLSWREMCIRDRLDTAAEMPLCRFPPLLPLKSLMRNTCGAGAKRMPSVTTTSTRFRSWNCGRQMRMRC